MDLRGDVAAAVGRRGDVQQDPELLELDRGLVLRDHHHRDLASGEKLRLLAAGADQPRPTEDAHGALIEARHRGEIGCDAGVHGHGGRLLRLSGIQPRDRSDAADGRRRSVAGGDERGRRFDADGLARAGARLDELHLDEDHLLRADGDQVLHLLRGGAGDQLQPAQILLRFDRALQHQRVAEHARGNAGQAVSLEGAAERFGGEPLRISARTHERFHRWVELGYLLHALVVVAGERFALQHHALPGDPHLDAFEVPQKRPELAHQLLRVLPAHHHGVAEAGAVRAPDEEGGAALAHARDQQLASAAHLLDVGDLGLADGDARDVAGLDHLLLADAEGDDGAFWRRRGGGEEDGEQGQTSHDRKRDTRRAGAPSVKRAARR